MKKKISYIIMVLLITFFGIVSVSAEPMAELKKDSFTWSGVTDYSVARLKCNDISFTDASSITTSGGLQSSSGTVKFSLTKNNFKLTCTIYKAKELTGNDVDETIIEKSLVIGTIPTTTKKETTTTSNKSTDAKLKSLSIKDDSGNEIKFEPEFKSDVYEYNVKVSGDVKKISIDAIMNDPKANVIISDNVNDELKAGSVTKITIKVTAEDGKTQLAYNVNVTKEELSADAYLNDLKIDELPDFEFDKETFKYDIELGKDIKYLTITPTLSGSKSSYEITGNKNLKNGSKIRILVTAEDGTKKEYTLTISKNDESMVTREIKEEKDPLVIIILSTIGAVLLVGIVVAYKKL